MKNKKIIYAIIGIIILISIVVIIAIISNKPMLIDHTPKESTSIIEELKKKYPDKKYLKLTGGEILNEDTCFNKYSFINNNSIYIFNPEKLDSGEFTYKKVYDIDKNIKVMNITPDSQLKLNQSTIQYVEDFIKFLRVIINGILNNKYYFIVDPIFFDNMLTEAYYFLYLLKGARYGIQPK